jgi:hypothetical protein
MTDHGTDKNLKSLKLRLTKERAYITHFVTEVGKFTDTTPLDDYEYYKIDSRRPWLD